MITLRPHQIAAVDAVERSFCEGISRPLIDACVGAGKSLMYGELARREIARGGRVIIGAHTRELVEQNAAACRSLGLETGINAAALNERCWRAPVISAAIQSVYKNGVAFGPISMFCVDECFPAGTLISTSRGDVPIEDIHVGDAVHHALGTGCVEAVSCRSVDELVEIEFDDGTKLRCTAEHQLFTTQAWASAESAYGRKVFTIEGVRRLRDGFLSRQMESERKTAKRKSYDSLGKQPILFERVRFQEQKATRTGLHIFKRWTPKELAQAFGGLRIEGVRKVLETVFSSATNRGGVDNKGEEQSCLEQDSFLFNILLEEAGKCDVDSGREREDVSDVTNDRASAEGTRRERASFDQGTVGAISETWSRLGSGVGGSDLSTTRQWLSYVLQNRHGESKSTNSNRGGRQFAYRATKVARSKERCNASFVGVARVSRIKLTRPCNVYNLQVGGHPSYFANGFLVHNCHLVPHSESGMYRALHRALAYPRLVGGSGTVFRLQGGSLIEGKDAPFERVVYSYSILNGIRDGYLVPAYSAPALDKIDPSKLRTRQGEFTGESQDDQMLAAIDNHIAQMVHFGEDRRGWLIFEASTKAARAMAARLGEWGVPTGLVLGTTPAGERTAIVEAYRAGRLRALVNIVAMTTGFDVQHVDMLVMRRRTKSLGLYIQAVGRGIRTIGGNIEASIAAGKADCLVLDFAGNIDQHGPLDFIRPKSTKPSLTACDACGTRNVSASRTCWSCGATLLKNCPACLTAIEKDRMICPHCDYDMRTGPVEVKKSLSDRPSDSAIIAAYKSGSERVGGWLPIGQLWEHEGKVWARAGEAVNELGVDQRFRAARWLRTDPLAILVPHGSSRTIARQINIADGSELIVPLPQMRS